MSNMSYCRFTNTLSALRDCESAWSEPLGNEGGMTRDEHAARYDLLQLCKSIVEDYGDSTPDEYDEDDERADDD